jgi:hypothetical protein
MMSTKRNRENYLEIDHRDSPGITPNQAARIGLGGVPIGKGQVFKTAVATCSNCQKQMILNPLRTRERFYCQKCDSYHCDECALITRVTGVCKPFRQLLDEAISAYANGKPIPQIRRMTKIP